MKIQDRSPAPQIDVRNSWALDMVCGLDRTAAGLAADYLLASPRRRQVVHAALSSMVRPPHTLADAVGLLDIALPERALRHLLEGREAEVIERHFGHCPAGYLRALGHIGNYPEPLEFYADLFSVFADRQHVSIVRALSHLDKISQDALDLVRMLPDAWRKPVLVAKLGSAREARKFVRAIDLIQRWCPAATDDAITASIETLSGKRSVARIIARWMNRVEFSRGPLQDSHQIRMIENGDDLQRAALAMQNCMRDQIDDILAQTASFYEIKGAGMPVVVRFLRSSIGSPWTYDDTYVQGNLSVPPNIRHSTEQILLQHGIATERRGEATSADIEHIRQYLWAARYDVEDV